MIRQYLSVHDRPATPSVVAIGSFDGVHLGHQAVLGLLCSEAERLGLPSVVYTFDPPTKHLMQGTLFLSALPEKVHALDAAGVGEVIAQSFNAEFAAKSKTDFLDELRVLRPAAIVVGEDFYFGQQKSGSAADLREVTETLHVVPLLTQNGQEVKSTRVRHCLQEGALDEVTALLGRPYSACGVVVSGDQLGGKIGFPTANLQVAAGKALPNGVFAVWATLNGQRLAGMANIGTRPTVNGSERRFEVHLLSKHGELYGQEMKVEFVAKLRDEQRFDGLEALVAQLHRDREATAALLPH